MPPSACAKRPMRVRGGAGEGPLGVTEQLGLDQGVGDGRAVDRHERLARARRAGAQRLGHQLLAGPRFAGDEHGAAGVGHLRQHAEHRAPWRGRRPAARARVWSRHASGSVAARFAVALAVAPCRAPASASSSALELERLDEEVARARACIARTASGISGAAAHHDDRRAGLLRRAASRMSKPFTSRHAQVGQDDVEATHVPSGPGRPGRPRSRPRTRRLGAGAPALDTGPPHRHTGAAWSSVDLLALIDTRQTHQNSSYKREEQYRATLSVAFFLACGQTSMRCSDAAFAATQLRVRIRSDFLRTSPALALRQCRRLGCDLACGLDSASRGA